MEVYLLLVFLWSVGYFTIKALDNRFVNINGKMIYSIFAGILMFLVIGFRDKSIGADTEQYLYLYELRGNYDWHTIFKIDEWLFSALMKALSSVGIGEQGFLLIMSLIICVIFSVFYYKYSKNVFLSFYLHLTIGLFAMSMSGIRQVFAICIVIIAFIFMMKNKPISYIITIILAVQIHTSAIVFLPMYFIKYVKFNKKSGWILLSITTLTLVLRKPLIPVIEFLLPERYEKYGAFSNNQLVNPLLIVIALAIPFTVLILIGNLNRKQEIEQKNFSIFFTLSCINAIINILSLNSNMIGRVSFYFVIFNMVLIPNVIDNLKDPLLKLVATYFCILFPAIQFLMATPGGTMKIDNFKFFWQ
ncbi:EpsG family protein [Desemzia sp. FAM 23991]|uniref:EpsG family protein n=1 Tax=unclassified Desemzia TaxID=2685243 RepID=UPI003889C1E7